MLYKSPILMAAASPALLAKGCVNVLEISALKEYAGERWPRICEGVYARLETLLRAKLGQNDLFVRISDVAYLITMPTTDPDDVNAICLRVSFDLHVSFLGQCNLDQMQVSTVSNGDDDTLVLHRLPPARVISLAERAGIAIQPQAQPDKSGSAADLIECSVPSSSGKNLRTSGVLSNAMAALPEGAVKVEHVFTQIWSVLSRAITTYACEPKTIFVPPRIDPVPFKLLQPKERIEVEIAAFKMGADQLTKAYATDSRFLLAVPISFDVLGSPAGRMECLSLCHSLSYAIRPFLIFTIYGIPPGVGQTRLANLVNTLRPFARSISATISPDSRSYQAFHAYEGIGLHAVGFNLREFSPQSPFTQHDAEQLSRFSRQFNFGSFLFNVESKAILKFALDAQIQSLSGSVIAPACGEPQGVWRLTWGEVLAQPVVELWG
jgi:hypothetical protein